MLVETNHLAFRRGDGSRGDVSAKQNNFAGIGATGGGVPGESFPDIKTGVLAHMQHLSAYSGERVPKPVAQRTAENQDDIIARSVRLKRSVRYSDLTNRWAADSSYARSIEILAGEYASAYCSGKVPASVDANAASTALNPPSALGRPPHQDDAAREPGGMIKSRAHAPAGSASPHTTTLASPVRTVWRRPNLAGQQHTPQAPPPATRVAAATQRAILPDVPPALATATAAPVAPLAALPASMFTESGELPVPPAPKPAERPVRLLALAPRPPQLVLPAVPAQTPQEAHGDAQATAAAPLPHSATGEPPAEAQACKIHSASFGGTTTLLIRAATVTETNYTALTVLDGFEQSMAASFIASRAPGGATLGAFPSREAALAKARELCP